MLPRPPRPLIAAMPRSLDKGKRSMAPSPPLSARASTSSVPADLLDALRTPITPSRPSTSAARYAGDSMDIARPHSTEYTPELAALPSPPPAAHHATLPTSGKPRLLAQLARATLPTASISYAHPQRAVSSPSPPHSPHSPGRRSVDPGRTSMEAVGFPNLDPTTGLPMGAGEYEPEDAGPSLHLQKTISDIARRASVSSLPRTSDDAARPDRRHARGFSSTAASQSQDWASWATSWFSPSSGASKKDMDRVLSEDDQASTAAEEKARIRTKYRTPKHPLVFCHGLLGFDYLGPASVPPLQISHWRGIREALEANGVSVMIARVPATASIRDRATILEELIADRFPGQPVNLIAHSMGGLDCRYLCSQLAHRFRPVTLTTISTPHRGSPFADYVIDNVIGRDRLPQLLSVMEAMRLPNSGDGSAFRALGTRAMKEFNAEVIDAEDVKYYSWGASCSPGLFDTFRWPHSVILAKEGPNDGLVSVHSAMWGEYRGTLVGVNHLDLVGWVNHVRYALSGWTGNPITFKPATFYLEISDYLAEQGF
ncbi:lipase 2 [Cryptotrichosporon argae]